MSNVPLTNDDEIDLLSLIQTIWDGKWKIVSIIAVSLLSVFGFNILKPNTTFIASTEIKPITSFEFDKYSLYNSTDFFKVNIQDLLNLYIENIEEGSLLEVAVEKFNLINKDDFDSEIEYKDSVEKFASEIEILRPIKEKNEIRLHHILSGEYNDKVKWKQLLSFVNEEANRKVKASIINRFATIVSIQNQKKKFALKDVDIKIDNVRKDYVRKTQDRIAFLTEQAAIARKLDIQKNTIASQRFNAQNTFVTNVKIDAPFYLRGYIAIEEEIKQINARKDKNAFTTDLFKLEQQKRTLEQDKSIERAIDLFNKTPLNQADFRASLLKVATTDFETNNKRNLIYALAIVLGGIIGVFYLLLSDAFANRRTISTNSS